MASLFCFTTRAERRLDVSDWNAPTIALRSPVSCIQTTERVTRSSTFAVMRVLSLRPSRRRAPEMAPPFWSYGPGEELTPDRWPPRLHRGEAPWPPRPGGAPSPRRSGSPVGAGGAAQPRPAASRGDPQSARSGGGWPARLTPIAGPELSSLRLTIALGSVLFGEGAGGY